MNKIIEREREKTLEFTATTASKTSLRNKHLPNDDYFTFIAFCSNSILLTTYATGDALVVAP